MLPASVILFEDKCCILSFMFVLYQKKKKEKKKAMQLEWSFKICSKV